MSDKPEQPAYDPLDWLHMADDERWRARRLGDRRVHWSSGRRMKKARAALAEKKE